MLLNGIKLHFHIFKNHCPVANREQIYDSFSLPSACICHYKSPTTLRDLRIGKVGSKSSSTTPSYLPRCQAGTKLALPTFVDSFSGSGRQQSSSIKRQDFNPIIYPDDNSNNRRLPRSVSNRLTLRSRERKNA